MGASSAAAAVLRAGRERARPVALSSERHLPVLGPLAPLLPDGALQRGTVVRVGGTGATSLALALAAAASAEGAWVGAVGLAGLGLRAAGELGVALHRLVAVPDPGARWAAVTSALVDGMDLVLAAPPVRARPADGRRLVARVRDRGAVLVAVGPGAGAVDGHVTLQVRPRGWLGPEAGAGRLERRVVEVEASGRGAAARPRRAALLLPGPDGAVDAVDIDADGSRAPGVTPLRATG
jgi:hypothetical protein